MSKKEQVKVLHSPQIMKSNKGAMNVVVTLVLGAILLLVVGGLMFAFFSPIILKSMNNTYAAAVDNGFATAADVDAQRSQVGQVYINIPLILIMIVLIVLLVGGLFYAVKHAHHGKGGG